MRTRLLPTLVLTLLGMSGCGGGVVTKPEFSVSGKVTFQGQPVTEGTVHFEDATSGSGGSGVLGLDGAYSAQVPEGDYKVFVLPPLEALPDSESSPGGMVPKQVKNIPPKYQSVDTSPLTAKVSAEQTEHNFEMMP